jgi:hypothetical protein
MLFSVNLCHSLNVMLFSVNLCHLLNVILCHSMKFLLVSLGENLTSYITEIGMKSRCRSQCNGKGEASEEDTGSKVLLSDDILDNVMGVSQCIGKRFLTEMWRGAMYRRECTAALH